MKFLFANLIKSIPKRWISKLSSVPKWVNESHVKSSVFPTGFLNAIVASSRFQTDIDGSTCSRSHQNTIRMGRPGLGKDFLVDIFIHNEIIIMFVEMMCFLYWNWFNASLGILSWLMQSIFICIESNKMLFGLFNHWLLKVFDF